MNIFLAFQYCTVVRIFWTVANIQPNVYIYRFYMNYWHCQVGLRLHICPPTEASHGSSHAWCGNHLYRANVFCRYVSFFNLLFVWQYTGGEYRFMICAHKPTWISNFDKQVRGARECTHQSNLLISNGACKVCSKPLGTIHTGKLSISIIILVSAMLLRQTLV